MPYRRLPNTDSARIRALKVALNLSSELNSREIAFSQKTLQELEFFLPKFEAAIKNHRSSLASQMKNKEKYNEYLQKTRLYVSHFIQVLNFTIIREELKPEVREYYGISQKDKTVPSLMSDAEVLNWGEKIIKGEKERTMRGGNPIYSPSIALVRVNYENFKQSYSYQKMSRNNTTRFREEVASLRKKADVIILSIWNGVEGTFNNLPSSLYRKKCKEYGVVYVFRKEERKKLNHLEEVEQESV